MLLEYQTLLKHRIKEFNAYQASKLATPGGTTGEKVDYTNMTNTQLFEENLKEAAVESRLRVNHYRKERRKQKTISKYIT